MLALLMAIPLALAQAQALPLPEIVRADCALADVGQSGTSLERWTIVLANSHTTKLLAWTLHFTTQHGVLRGKSSEDRLFSPGLWVKPGDTVTVQRYRPCEEVPAVAAAFYDDSTADGFPDAIEETIESRRARAQRIRMVLSVLTTSRLGEEGVEDNAQVRALIQRVAGADRQSAQDGLAAAFNSARTKHLANRLAPRQRVSKADLMEAMATTARVLDDATRVSIGRDAR